MNHFAHLREAIACAAHCRRVAARRHVDAALAARPRDGTVRTIAGLILFVTRDYQRCLDELYTATSLSPRKATRTVELIVERAGRLGWEADVRDAIDAGIEVKPRHPRWYAAAAASHARGRDYPAALHYTEKALALAPDSPKLRMEQGNLLARIGRVAEARAAAAAALEVAPPELIYKLEAARIFADAGGFAEAALELRAAMELNPDDPRASAQLAHLAAWRGDLGHAVELAEQALALDPELSLAGTVIAATEVMSGEHQRAAERLDSILARDRRCSEAYLWRAEARMHLGDFEGAHDDLTWGSMSADGYVISAWILRLLVNIAEGDPLTVIRPERQSEIIDGLAEMCPRARERFASADPEIISALLREGLERLSGNRSTITTWLDDRGQLHRLQTRTGARHASRHALELIRSTSVEGALAQFDRVIESFGHDSLPLAHRGELHLWAGNFEQARADLLRAIELNRHTRWAYIGLTGIDLLEGNPQQALETSARGVRVMGGTEGPAVFAYRGEALLRLGRLDEAIADLERAVAERPGRLGAWIGLALAHQGAGHTDELGAIFDRLRRGAPGLIGDAAALIGETVWLDDDALPDAPVMVAVLEQALSMMRGNRSSTCTTYFCGDAMRYVTSYGDPGAAPHAGDGADLALARRLLARAAPRRHRRRLLSDAEIESFLSRGYLELRGCFSRQVAAEWVAGACRRVSDAPARWVKGLHEGAGDLGRFDPNDPATWTRERLEIEGDHQVSIEEMAPKAWDAICDLLGGPHRVETRTWSNYLIANLRAPQGSSEYAPQRSSESWHLDDPSRRMHLDSCDRGLIVISLFSDVAREGGGTYLAPQSVAHVARLLAQSPEGVDFSDRARGPAIVEQCEERVEVTGETGDVFLLHPFLMHSASINPSGRIRWIGNPMIYLHEPLDFDRDDPSHYSPVELAVVRALGRD